MLSKLTVNGREPVIFVFPGGEVSVRITDEIRDHIEETRYCRIEARLVDAQGIMALALLRNALLEWDVDLFMPYIPYARQDRICNEGEAFSSKVFAQMINAMKFNSIRVADPHSAVCCALFDCPVYVMEQHEIIAHCPYIAQRLGLKKWGLVSPDDGASKKTQALAMRYRHPYWLKGQKHRNPEDGKLSGFGYSGICCNEDHLLIVDDICDGGGTFLGLAEELKKGHPTRKVYLYVTHGIFSKGLHVFNDIIDGIFTTDSLPQPTPKQAAAKCNDFPGYKDHFEVIPLELLL